MTITYLCNPLFHSQKAGKKCPVFFARTLESYDCKTSRELLVLYHRDTTGIPEVTFASNTQQHTKNSQQSTKIRLQVLTEQVLQSLLYST